MGQYSHVVVTPGRFGPLGSSCMHEYIRPHDIFFVLTLTQGDRIGRIFAIGRLFALGIFLKKTQKYR
jgi:hypothetical protein